MLVIRSASNTIREHFSGLFDSEGRVPMIGDNPSDFSFGDMTEEEWDEMVNSSQKAIMALEELGVYQNSSYSQEYIVLHNALGLLSARIMGSGEHYGRN